MAVEAAKNGAKLIVYPEMASTGFLYLTEKEAGPNIDTVPGIATEAFGKVADEHNIYIAYGLIEKDPDTGVIYNSAAMVGPKGFVAKYRKNQLAVGDDNLFRAPGNIGFPVFDTELGKIAMLVCYDDSQLQSLLLPALRGADIIAYPTASLYNPRAEGGNQDHTTIGSMATLPGWMGVNVVGADTSGIDAGKKSTAALISPGGSTIWNSRGEVLAIGSRHDMDGTQGGRHHLCDDRHRRAEPAARLLAEAPPARALQRLQSLPAGLRQQCQPAA